ncbi:MAG: bifunctional 2-C-methyl-D-erythritol 4-phosphate cytidylyltransferase/2-C-methyl-D-erythritol 2,4-cyclodiphosphate synthase [Pseudomonadota bacterium]
MPENRKKPKTIALLVAAGHSERMGGGVPKPYINLGSESILQRTVKAFLAHPDIDGVRVVIRREHHPYYRKAIGGLAIIPCVIGGSSRQESVRLGLESLAEHKPDRVLVHDIARPFVNRALISRVLAGLNEHQAVIPVIAINDTIKRVEDGVVTGTIERAGAVQVQTPQGFDYKMLVDAHKQAIGKELTDDAAVCELANIKVFTVDGENENFKITNAEDLKRMENNLILNSETRVGIGYDVHVLAEHDLETPIIQQNIKLCGVRIPFSHYLVGHSDADVGLHAIVDAILGAISAQDIGAHFPPTDPKWQGADSERFLLHAYGLLKNRGGELVNIDVTLICERPKISVHRETMIEHIANILKIEKHRISVKATTTEKLGFAGRGEGVAAQAVATVRLPR